MHTKILTEVIQFKSPERRIVWPDQLLGVWLNCFDLCLRWPGTFLIPKREEFSMEFSMEFLFPSNSGLKQYE